MAPVLVTTHLQGQPTTRDLYGFAHTDSGMEPRKQCIYPFRWTRCDREADYERTWSTFTERLQAQGVPVPLPTGWMPEDSNEGGAGGTG